VILTLRPIGSPDVLIHQNFRDSCNFGESKDQARHEFLFKANVKDYRWAVQQVFRSPGHASHIEMSILGKPSERLR
jgi:hypothetical protein